jgi:hypothetical protein
MNLKSFKIDVKILKNFNDMQFTLLLAFNSGLLIELLSCKY